MDQEKVRRFVKKMVELASEIDKELGQAPSDTASDFLRWYGSEYEKRFGNPYIISWAREGALVKQMLKTLTMEQTKSRAEQFLDSNDPFILRAGKTVSVFFSMINKLGPVKKTGLEGFLVQ